MTNLCDRYHFDRAARARRLALLGLSAADHALAKTLHEQVIVPNAEFIVNAFYAHLFSQPETSAILSSGVDIDRLRRTQGRYLHTLGIGFDRKEYFEERLRVGWAHARANIPLSIYQCAYCRLQMLITEAFPPSLANSAKIRTTLTDFVLKITTLDMSLAIQTYHGSHVEQLERSLDALRHEELELRHSAEMDTLTGVANRRHIMDLLARLVHVARTDRVPLSIGMLDVDRFKEINDTHGHLVGDQVLRGVAARARSAVREFDTVGRFGGEEFLMLLINMPLDRAAEIAERVRRRVADTPINVQGLEIHATVSIGLAVLDESDDIESLIKRADIALYRAKDTGRNRVCTA